MRWSIAVILASLLFVPPPAGALEQWGCCVPTAGECFPGSGVYGTQAEFQSACTAAQGAVQGAGQYSTCAPLMGQSSAAVCQTGCCCAGDAVQDSPTINNDEALLGTTRNECGLQGSGYDFRMKPAGQTCVQVCGGDMEPQPTGAYAISGTVKNATSDGPLAGATIYVPIPGGELTATSDAQGRYTLEDVPAITARIFATHPMCRPAQTAPIIFREDRTGVNVTLDCTRQACQHARLTVEQLLLVQGTDRATFNIGFTDSCDDLVHFEPLRCDGQFENCRALAPSTSPSITDAGLEPGTTYCYTARARFADGRTEDSEKTTGACVTTGAGECMTRPAGAPATWCGAGAILRCDERNELQATSCEGTSVCSMRGGTATCGIPPPCDRCNGLLGFFADLGLTIFHDERELSCEEAERLGLCYEDRVRGGRPLVIDTLNACLAVDDCSQYRSADACGANTCDVSDTCTWKTINEELGLGLCMGTGAPACERCDELLGYCDRQACGDISDQCYFDEDPNGLGRARGCLAKEDMACRYYDTKADCAPSGDAEYDIRFDPAGRRVGGDNGRTSSSADAFAFGACSWVGENSYCIKDADNNRSAQQEDDCYENGHYRTDPECYVDRTPPVTTFFLADPPVYGRAALQTLPYTVTDDRSPSQLIRTYVCLQGADEAPCYPDMTLSGLPGLPEAGSYTLRFYSIDASQNSEIIKEAAIRLEESANAELESISIEENR